MVKHIVQFKFRADVSQHEREKAAAGFLYDANYDGEFARQRAECKDKCHRYRASSQSAIPAAPCVR